MKWTCRPSRHRSPPRITELPPPPAPVAVPAPKPLQRRSRGARRRSCSPPRNRLSPPTRPPPEKTVADATPKPAAEPAAAEERAEVIPGAAATGKTLPPRVDLAYKVFWGTRGFLIGEAVYRFEHKDHRYRIATVGEARGLAALILRGQGKLESRGVITEQGLQPSILRIERGGPDRVETAVFDWEAGIVHMHDNKTAPLDLPTFDPLSLMWQYYFTPPDCRPGDGHRRDAAPASCATRSRAKATETIEWPHGPIVTERWHRAQRGRQDRRVHLARAVAAQHPGQDPRVEHRARYARGHARLHPRRR